MSHIRQQPVKLHAPSSRCLLLLLRPGCADRRMRQLLPLHLAPLRRRRNWRLGGAHGAAGERQRQRRQRIVQPGWKRRGAALE